MFIALKFLLSIAFVVSHKFWYVVFSFSFVSKYFLIFFVISSLVHWLFKNLLLEVLRQVWFLNFPTKLRGKLILQKALLHVVTIWFWANHVIFLGLFSHLQNEVGLSGWMGEFRVNDSWSLLSSLSSSSLCLFSFLRKTSHPFPLLFCCPSLLPYQGPGRAGD